MDLDRYRKTYLDFVREERKFDDVVLATRNRLTIQNVREAGMQMRIEASKTCDRQSDFGLGMFQEIEVLEARADAAMRSGDMKGLESYSPSDEVLNKNLGLLRKSFEAKRHDIESQHDGVVYSLGMKISNEALAESCVDYAESVERLRAVSPEQAVSYDYFEIPTKPIFANVIGNTMEFGENHETFMILHDTSNKRFYIVPDEVEVRLAAVNEPLRFEPWRDARYVISLPTELALVSSRNLEIGDVQDVCPAGSVARNGCCGDVSCNCGPDSGPSPRLAKRIEDYQNGLSQLAARANKLTRDS